MKPQMSPLFSINRAFVAMEAIDLAHRAGRGETPWSRTNPEAPLDTGRDWPSMETRSLRRAAAAVAALALVGGLAVAGWIA